MALARLRGCQLTTQCQDRSPWLDTVLQLMIADELVNCIKPTCSPLYLVVYLSSDR